ncbi:MAG: MBOAT family protein [Candidatus Delongbacteria bacterium]|nr:MBOAT family protein [Candidatus Delongbacteria bacterium]
MNRRLVFWVAIFFNLIPLFIFKYYNFFVDSINDTGNIFGVQFNLITLKLFLPVGISFYTFLSLSYIIDVYKKQVQFEKNFIRHSVSLSYFPIIMSGPIHRPRYLLKQLNDKIEFNYSLVVDGLRQFLWGLFSKVVIADSLAKHVGRTFNDYSSMNGNSVLLGTIYFSFQLYFDFNGYSNMAIGISKMLGIPVERNFEYPYLSRTIADFWKRWHISLTRWFRDYIFLPISFIVSRKVKQDSVFNTDLMIYSIGIIITWTLTGLWHGSNWTFIVWGMIHAFLLILNKTLRKKKKKLLKQLGIKYKNNVLVLFEGVLTFFIVNFVWIFFRSDSLKTANSILFNIFNLQSWNSFQITAIPLILILIILLLEFLQKNKNHVLDIGNKNIYFRWFSYLIITMTIIYFAGNSQTFIYAGF